MEFCCKVCEKYKKTADLENVKDRALGISEIERIMFDGFEIFEYNRLANRMSGKRSSDSFEKGYFFLCNCTHVLDKHNIIYPNFYEVFSVENRIFKYLSSEFFNKNFEKQNEDNFSLFQKILHCRSHFLSLQLLLEEGKIHDACDFNSFFEEKVPIYRFLMTEGCLLRMVGLFDEDPVRMKEIHECLCRLFHSIVKLKDNFSNLKFLEYHIIKRAFITTFTLKEYVLSYKFLELLMKTEFWRKEGSVCEKTFHLFFSELKPGLEVFTRSLMVTFGKEEEEEDFEEEEEEEGESEGEGGEEMKRIIKNCSYRTIIGIRNFRIHKYSGLRDRIEYFPQSYEKEKHETEYYLNESNYFIYRDSKLCEIKELLYIPMNFSFQYFEIGSGYCISNNPFQNDLDHTNCLLYYRGKLKRVNISKVWNLGGGYLKIRSQFLDYGFDGKPRSGINSECPHCYDLIYEGNGISQARFSIFQISATSSRDKVWDEVCTFPGGVLRVVTKGSNEVSSYYKGRYLRNEVTLSDISCIDKHNTSLIEIVRILPMFNLKKDYTRRKILIHLISSNRSDSELSHLLEDFGTCFGNMEKNILFYDTITFNGIKISSFSPSYRKFIESLQYLNLLPGCVLNKIPNDVLSHVIIPYLSEYDVILEANQIREEIETVLSSDPFSFFRPRVSLNTFNLRFGENPILFLKELMIFVQSQDFSSLEDLGIYKIFPLDSIVITENYWPLVGNGDRTARERKKKHFEESKDIIKFDERAYRLFFNVLSPTIQKQYQLSERAYIRLCEMVFQFLLGLKRKFAVEIHLFPFAKHINYFIYNHSTEISLMKTIFLVVYPESCLSFDFLQHNVWLLDIILRICMIHTAKDLILNSVTSRQKILKFLEVFLKNCSFKCFKETDQPKPKRYRVSFDDEQQRIEKQRTMHHSNCLSSTGRKTDEFSPIERIIRSLSLIDKLHEIFDNIEQLYYDGSSVFVLSLMTDLLGIKDSCYYTRSMVVFETIPSSSTIYGAKIRSVSDVKSFILFVEKLIFQLPDRKFGELFIRILYSLDVILQYIPNCGFLNREDYVSFITMCHKFFDRSRKVETSVQDFVLKGVLCPLIFKCFSDVHKFSIHPAIQVLSRYLLDLFLIHYRNVRQNKDKNHEENEEEEEGEEEELLWPFNLSRPTRAQTLNVEMEDSSVETDLNVLNILEKFPSIDIFTSYGKEVHDNAKMLVDTEYILSEMHDCKRRNILFVKLRKKFEIARFLMNIYYVNDEIPIKRLISDNIHSLRSLLEVEKVEKMKWEEESVEEKHSTEFHYIGNEEDFCFSLSVFEAVLNSNFRTELSILELSSLLLHILRSFEKIPSELLSDCENKKSTKITENLAENFSSSVIVIDDVKTRINSFLERNNNHLIYNPNFLLSNSEDYSLHLTINHLPNVVRTKMFNSLPEESHPFWFLSLFYHSCRLFHCRKRQGSFLESNKGIHLNDRNDNFDKIVPQFFIEMSVKNKKKVFSDFFRMVIDLIKSGKIKMYQGKVIRFIHLVWSRDSQEYSIHEFVIVEIILEFINLLFSFVCQDFKFHHYESSLCQNICFRIIIKALRGKKNLEVEKGISRSNGDILWKKLIEKHLYTLLYYCSEENIQRDQKKIQQVEEEFPISSDSKRWFDNLGKKKKNSKRKRRSKTDKKRDKLHVRMSTRMSTCYSFYSLQIIQILISRENFISLFGKNEESSAERIFENIMMKVSFVLFNKSSRYRSCYKSLLISLLENYHKMGKLDVLIRKKIFHEKFWIRSSDFLYEKSSFDQIRHDDNLKKSEGKIFVDLKLTQLYEIVIYKLKEYKFHENPLEYMNSIVSHSKRITSRNPKKFECGESEEFEGKEEQNTLVKKKGINGGGGGDFSSEKKQKHGPLGKFSNFLLSSRPEEEEEEGEEEEENRNLGEGGAEGVKGGQSLTWGEPEDQIISNQDLKKSNISSGRSFRRRRRRKNRQKDLFPLSKNSKKKTTMYGRARETETFDFSQEKVLKNQKFSGEFSFPDEVSGKKESGSVVSGEEVEEEEEAEMNRFGDDISNDTNVSENKSNVQEGQEENVNPTSKEEVSFLDFDFDSQQSDSSNQELDVEKKSENYDNEVFFF